MSRNIIVLDIIGTNYSICVDNTDPNRHNIFHGAYTINIPRGHVNRQYYEVSLRRGVDKAVEFSGTTRHGHKFRYRYSVEWENGIPGSTIVLRRWVPASGKITAKTFKQPKQKSDKCVIF